MDCEATLPQATVKQIILKSVNPVHKSSVTGITSLVSELAQEFISSVSEMAYNECLNSGKKTIMPEHVISVLKKSGFPVDDSEIEQFIGDLNKIKAVISN
jgi:histone H3/H4